MIYTITLNPAIDHIILSTKPIELEITNYYDQEYVVVGGKGINTAIVLKNLQSKVKAIGILGKNNDQIFNKKFEEINLDTQFFNNNGNTRVNYKLKHLQTNQETELNGLGFTVESEILDQFLDYLKSNLKENDIVIATGSVARGIDQDIYATIGKIINQKKAIFICDATNKLLKNALKEKPFLIKPNLEEICSTLEIEYDPSINTDQLHELVKKLQSMGARNVLVSMGSKGSIYFDKNNDIYKVGIAKGELVNSVGAGDSMLAGFVYGIDKNLSIENKLRYAAASGAATAFDQWLGSQQAIESLVESISVEKI